MKSSNEPVPERTRRPRKQKVLLAGAAVLAFTLGAGGLVLANSLQAQAESTTQASQKQLADVAKRMPRRVKKFTLMPKPR